MKKTYMLIAILSMVTLFSAQGQDNERDEIRKRWYPWAVSFNPTYLFNSGLRLDLHKQIPHSDNLLTLGVMGYLVPRNDDDYYGEWDMLFSDIEFTKMHGIGIEPGFKYFLPLRNRFLYLGASASYTYFNISYMDNYYNQYTENGLNYYEQLYGEMDQHIHRLSVMMTIGIQNSRRIPFLADGYIGLGYKYALRDNNKQSFDSNMLSPGYRGFFIAMGINLGGRFGRRGR